MSAYDLPIEELIRRLNAGKNGYADPVKFAGVCKVACVRLEELSTMVTRLTQSNHDLENQLKALEQSIKEITVPNVLSPGSQRP